MNYRDKLKIDKINRNEKCPCGSGIKYKKCCLNKRDNLENLYSENLSPQNNLNKHIKEGLIKQCIYPKQDECSEKIIKAHSIQNNSN